MGWKAFTDIQEQAIPAVIGGEGDVLIASETASGKTEAAFLPILSLVEQSAVTGLKVVYVSPLKALINDQFQRIQELCELSGIAVHRWHGDVAQSTKNRFVQNPTGILQITPESIESLFINRTETLAQVLHQVEFLVIDEVHAFLGTERGTHLRSLLGRLRDLAGGHLRKVALSATIGDYEYARQWLSPHQPQSVQVVQGASNGKKTLYSLFHLPRPDNGRIPLEIIEDMRELTRPYYSLIFCNRKAEVEEACVLLNRLADREGMGQTYLPHHGNLAAAEREYAEISLRQARSPKSLVCTSTLELGINIGQVQLVAQLDSTFSVSSLKQRLGRSGRGMNTPRMFQLYTTSDAGLVQSIAVTELFLTDWVEPPRDYSTPYDVLWHQILSTCAQHNGLHLVDLMSHLKRSGAFDDIPDADVRQLVQDMVSKDYLEQIVGTAELIPGIAGERILRGRDFYAVFETPAEFEVVHKAAVIGTLPVLPVYQKGAHVILGGKLWKIVEVDEHKLKLYVEVASGAQRPKFLGDRPNVHHRIRTEMANIVQGTKQFPYLYGQGQDALESIRKPYRLLGVTPGHRVVAQQGDAVEVRAFAGDVVLHTMALMIKQQGLSVEEVGSWGWLRLHGCSPTEVRTLLQRVSKMSYTPLELVSGLGEDLYTTKFGRYLPDWAKQMMHVAAWVDIPAARKFLEEVQWMCP